MRLAQLVIAGALLGAGPLPPHRAVAQEIPGGITRPCVHPCPSVIQLVRDPRLDQLTLHARVVPGTSIDPAFETFTVDLSNANGTIFSATLNPGEMRELAGGKRVVYRNPAARRAGGISRVQITQRNDAPGGYRVDVVAHGDLSSATLDEMTVFLLLGDDGFFDTSTWSPRRSGWAHDFVP
jgi:hypothetical protein